MSVKVDNNAYELVITPNKRKRDYPGGGQFLHDYGNSNKENHFVYNNFMEVKSISEIFAKKQDVVSAPTAVAMMTDNPYEVSRKPPKKKTRRDIDTDDGCFVNPALNLNGPEKVLNPFEVRREPPVKQDTHCFVNSGLNLRGAEREVRNPFEIERDSVPAKEMQGTQFDLLSHFPWIAMQLANLTFFFCKESKIPRWTCSQPDPLDCHSLRLLAVASISKIFH